jgi:hypothetical protein
LSWSFTSSTINLVCKFFLYPGVVIRSLLGVFMLDSLVATFCVVVTPPPLAYFSPVFGLFGGLKLL